MPKPLLSTRSWFFALRHIYVALTHLVLWTRTNARERMPSEGPVLILANHVSFLDPPQVGSFVGRNVHFMTSEQLFRVPVLGFLVEKVGAFPKKKFVKDRDSMVHLNQLYEAGEVVALFPEGSRSWDGRQLPILSGIARLIKRLDARVMFVRLQTAHLQHPRWARWPRRVPSVMEADSPRSFPPEMSHEEILEVIRERLSIDWRREAPRGSFGMRMAEGLPQYVWACPSCFAVDGLQVSSRDRNRVGCKECGQAWRVDVHARMNPADGGEPLLIPDAHDAVKDHFGTPPALDRERYRETGEALWSVGARIHQFDKGRKADSQVVAEGRLVLTDEALIMEGTPWRLPLADLQVVSMVIGGALQLRARGTLYRVEPGASTPSSLWAHFLGHRIGQKTA